MGGLQCSGSANELGEIASIWISAQDFAINKLAAAAVAPSDRVTAPAAAALMHLSDMTVVPARETKCKGELLSPAAAAAAVDVLLPQNSPQ